jgi:hypothetical protein
MEEVQSATRSGDRAALLVLHDELMAVARSGSIRHEQASHAVAVIAAVEAALTARAPVALADGHQEAEKPLNERLEDAKSALASSGDIAPDDERRNEHRTRSFAARLDDAKQALYGPR